MIKVNQNYTITNIKSKLHEDFAKKKVTDFVTRQIEVELENEEFQVDTDVTVNNNL